MRRNKKTKIMIRRELGCIPSFWFSFGINMPSRRRVFVKCCVEYCQVLLWISSTPWCFTSIFRGSVCWWGRTLSLWCIQPAHFPEWVIALRLDAAFCFHSKIVPERSYPQCPIHSVLWKETLQSNLWALGLISQSVRAWVCPVLLLECWSRSWTALSGLF